MAKIPCPHCQGTGEVQSPRDTIRMNAHDADELRAQAMRTPIPPPAPLPRPLQDSELEVTMPTSGWLEKHVRQETKKQKRGGLFLAIMLTTAFTILGTIQFCNQRYP